MSSAKGNNNDDSQMYEQQRLANIGNNKRRLAALNIQAIVNSMAPQRRRRKRKHYTIDETASRPNLRPRTQRRNVQHEQDQVIADLEEDGDFLSNNEDHSNINLSNGTENRRKGRGITKKDDIFSRTPDMPKIKILLNDHGQPVGKHYRQLSSVIGCQVRKKLSIACVDWRLVDADKKYELWTDLKAFYDIPDDAYNWFMRIAAMKWKQFKAAMKKRYFKPEMTIEEVGGSPDKRINNDDWQLLWNYWMSAEFQARSAIAKQNRAKLVSLHTLGSVSYASSAYDLAVKLGRPPRRDEHFIKSHTRKNGVPSRQSELVINQLKDIIEVYPELKERTIQQGDAFSVVCGEKEPKGYVRVMGLGPTPQDIGTPGLKCYAPTRLQMEILARKKVEMEKATLEQRLDQLQAQIDLIQQRAQQDRGSEEPMSQHGSTSRQPDIHDDGLDEEEEEYSSADEEFNEYQIFPRQVATQPKPCNNAAPRTQHQALVGKDVILYAIFRSDQPVAKGTITVTKPSIMVAGQALGKEYCEVIVTHVLKRDAILPRPYMNVDTMGDAEMMSIAWPYKKLKVTNKAATLRNIQQEMLDAVLEAGSVGHMIT